MVKSLDGSGVNSLSVSLALGDLSVPRSVPPPLSPVQPGMGLATCQAQGQTPAGEEATSAPSPFTTSALCRTKQDTGCHEVLSLSVFFAS